MSAKGPRLASLVEGCAGTPYDPRYVGWFRCFNAAAYYDAHDVLESLWAERGSTHPDRDFFKGLIQLAGGFVHMRLQREHPDHRIHGARLPPAARLLALARDNLARLEPAHAGMDVAAALALASDYLGRLGEGRYVVNPWDPARPPCLAYPLGARDCPAAQAGPRI